MSKLVRAGSPLLEDSEKLRELKLAELRRLMDDARLSGEGSAAEDVFARLEAKYRALAERA